MDYLRAADQSHGIANRQNRQRIAIILVAVAAAGALVPKAAFAVDLTDVARPAALDQPQINLLLRTPSDTVIQGATIDPFTGDRTPTINIGAYLDTGASGILLSTSVADSQAWNLPAQTYNGQTIVFNDIGVAGSAPFNVSQQLNGSLAPYQPGINDTQLEDPSIYTQHIGPFRAQIGPIVDPTNLFTQDPNYAFLVEDLNVVGMPALAGKVMVVDSRRGNQAVPQINAQGLDNYILDSNHPENIYNLFLKTYLYNPGTTFHSGTIETDPGIPSANLHVKLSYADFSGFTTITPSGAPGPTFLHNPFVGPNPLASPGTDNTPKIKLSFFDPLASSMLSTSGSFLLDTGAGASFISENIAAQLHVRYRPGTQGTDNPQLEIFNPGNPSAQGTLIPDQFQLAVGGIGGQVTESGFYLDSLLVPTIEGNAANAKDPRHLNFGHAPVLVTNITLQNANQTITLDGDLGMNFFVTGLDIKADQNSPLGIDIGSFASGGFDWVTFDEPNGILGLSLNSNFHIAGDLSLDGKLTSADIAAMMGALTDMKKFGVDHGLTDAQLAALGDIEQSGTFTNADLQLLITTLANSGGAGSLAAVPEPAGVVLAVLGAAATLIAVRRGRES